MYKVAPSQIGLYYSRGVQVVYPVKSLIKKVPAVRTKEGHVLIQDRPDLPYAMSIEEIKDAYGGEIIEVEIAEEVTMNSKYYMSTANFPKVKNLSAIEKAFQKYETYMNSLGKKKK